MENFEQRILLKIKLIKFKSATFSTKTKYFNISLCFLYILTFIICFEKIISNRLEPLNIILERTKFLKENIGNFTTNLDFVLYENQKFTTEFKISSKKCVAKKNIRANEEIFSISLDQTINLYDEFPMKKIFLHQIKDHSITKINKNITNHLLLTLRIMFDMRADFKKTYINLKRYDQKEFLIMKNYLLFRNDFIHKYIKLLPLAEYFGQMSWSNDDFEDYKLTGIMPNTKDKIFNFYKELIEEIKLDKDKFYLYNVTNDWLNENNSNYFLSLYGYVISKSFIFNLEFLETINDMLTSQLKIYENDLNKEIIKNGGGLIIIPFIDYCGHYQPGRNSKNINHENSFQLKRIKINLDNNKNKIVVKSNSNLEKNDEFLYSFTDFLTNDNLLLNYGIFIFDNIFQEFLFKFEMEDFKYNFFNSLRSNNFDVTRITFLGEFKLSLQFSLKKDVFSKELFDFISIYSKNFIQDETIPNDNQIKNKKFIDKKMEKNIYMLLKSLVLYDSTINKNIFSIIDSSEINENNKKNYHNFFIEKIQENIEKIIKINNIIYNYTVAINMDKKNEKFEHDDIKNLFYYKALHENKKSLFIKIFNLENIKILFSHKNIINKEIISILNKNIKDLKILYQK